LLAHLIGEIIGIDCGLGFDTGRGQLLEDAVKTIVRRRCGTSNIPVAAP